MNWEIVKNDFKTKGILTNEYAYLPDSAWLKKSIDVECKVQGDGLVFEGPNMVDFLSKVYDRDIDENYNKYLYFIKGLPIVNFKKAYSEAITPTKKFATDEGYDLYITKVDKVISPNTIRFDTGIIVEPPIGWHVEVLPRSSLSNSGYMLTNSIGLIDSSYRGSIKIALTRVANSELILPYKGFQLVLRENRHFIFKEISDMKKTSRDKGGFGSTN